MLGVTKFPTKIKCPNLGEKKVAIFADKKKEFLFSYLAPTRKKSFLISSSLIWLKPSLNTMSDIFPTFLQSFRIKRSVELFCPLQDLLVKAKPLPFKAKDFFCKGANDVGFVHSGKRKCGKHVSGRNILFLETNSVHFLTGILLSYMCIFVHKDAFSRIDFMTPSNSSHNQQRFPLYIVQEKPAIYCYTMVHWISSIEQKASYGCFPVYAKQITTHVFPSFFYRHQIPVMSSGAPARIAPKNVVCQTACCVGGFWCKSHSCQAWITAVGGW